MPDYTVVTEGHGRSEEQVEVLHFDTDADAVLAAADMLGEQHRSAAVASGVGDDAEWMGAWDWHGGGRRWTPDE